ncbi:M28 family metallopeptidase [Tissierella praeacuta]|uniref:M28 family metallopeptidase n=1 Tax=Tissierella praeacuta TaxID=43131 RepID=UPI0033416BA8
MINKNRRFTFIFLISIILVYLITSCSYTDTSNSSKDSSIKSVLEFLTSDECDGRLPGTQGNKVAQDYIKDKFEEMGLETYGDNYSFEYLHSGNKVKKENYNMIIKFTDGEILNCQYGKDFLENDRTNINFKGKIALDNNDEDIENKFLLLEDEDGLVYEEHKAGGLLIPHKSFKRNVFATGGKSIPKIQISHNIYNKVKEKEVEEIDIKFEIESLEEEFSEHNVVGIIPGENRENAIVITAHFDHVGSKEDLIWRGAIDNGTGVSALLDIAEKLKEHSKSENFKQDIIICAFNGEDSGFQGSIPFVKEIADKYNNLYNINIDCVGIKDGGRLLIDGYSEENELVEELSKDFKDNEFDISVDKKLTVSGSDHIIFLNNNINAIGLSQEGLNSIIHSLEDDIDKVHIGYIEKLSDTIVKFIIENSHKNYDLPKDDVENTEISDDIPEIMKKIDEARNEARNKEKLEFNQYKYMEIEDQEVLVRNDCISFYKSHEGDNFEDLYTIYPEFSSIYNLGQYELGNIDVRDSLISYVDNPELDKIYTIEPKLENISDIDFTFFNTYGKKMKIMFGIEEKVENLEKSIILEYQYEDYNHIQNEEVEIKDELYRVMYSKENNNFNGFYREINGVKRNYKVAITSYDEESWEYKTLESGIEAYNELKIKEFIENILNTFENNL